MTLFESIKQKIWNIVYPIFPQIEHRLLFLHHKERQKFHIGWIAPHYTLADLKKHLSSEWGFGNHFVAWEDSSQVLSWRKLNSFNQQYHLRVFSDGELRGHFEYTPEAAPISHLMKTGQAAKTKDFLKFLGKYATTKKYISHIVPDTVIKPSKESEMTFNKQSN